MNTYKCLSIAGFDSSGGAGLQADLKTFSAWGCYGMTVLTALPVQNTQGVRCCYTIPVSAVHDQLTALFDDIVPHSIKIGMLFSEEIILCVSDFLKNRAQSIPLVIDPVMFSKTGDPLLQEEAMEALKTKLLPLATVITPNLPEALRLIGKKEHAATKKEIIEDLKSITSSSLLLKGGHDENTEQCDDWLYEKGQYTIIAGKRVDTKHTHGTGCTLSAAIASGLARGFGLEKSCRLAKNFVYHALIHAKKNSIGQGCGPVHHFHHIWPTLKWPEENET